VIREHKLASLQIEMRAAFRELVLVLVTGFRSAAPPRRKPTRKKGRSTRPTS
jgi:hypothetical protein